MLLAFKICGLEAILNLHFHFLSLFRFFPFFSQLLARHSAVHGSRAPWQILELVHVPMCTWAGHKGAPSLARWVGDIFLLLSPPFLVSSPSAASSHPCCPACLPLSLTLPRAALVFPSSPSFPLLLPIPAEVRCLSPPFIFMFSRS